MTHCKPPHVRGVPLLGLLPRLRRDPLQTYVDLSDYGDIVRFRMGPERVYLLSRPDYIKHVLENNQRNYSKGPLYRKLFPILGRGLVTSEGELWLRQRRMAQPSFRPRSIHGFVAAIVENANEMLGKWATRADDRPLDIADEMMRLTLDVVLDTLFSSGVLREFDKLRSAWNEVNEEIGRRLWQLFDPPRWWPSSGNRRYWTAIADLERIIYRIVDERRRSGKDMGDLLSMMLAAQDEETGATMDDRQLRDEITTLLFAGHETSSNALAWTWYLVSQHPEVERKLLAEIDEVLGERDPVAEDLRRLSYTKMVLHEAMRLYPPVYAVSRRAIADDKIDGFSIPAGSTVFMSQYAMNRHRRYWENPEIFDPERFSAEREKSRAKYLYFPFGGGGRICIGNHFAMTEMQLIVPTLLRRCRFELVDQHPVVPHPLITLKPRYGIAMKVYSR